MPKVPVLILDLDNTVYDWYAAFLPALYSMIDEATAVLGTDRDTLLDQLREVHKKYRDVEHPFSLVETPLVQNLIAERGRDAALTELDSAFHAFNRSRKENLRLFPHAMETMLTLKSNGIRLVAYTDSTYFAASGRIRRLGLTDIFTKVYCRERGKSILHEEYAAPMADDLITELPSHESKPNPRVLADIILSQHVLANEVAYIGDSLAKDVLMAKRAGCFAIWAKYGAHTDADMYQRLIRVSHWTEEDIAREKNYAAEAKNIDPDFVCRDSISELLSVPIFE